MKPITIKSIFTFLILCICIFQGYSQTNKFEYTPKIKKRLEVINILGNLNIKGTNKNVIEIVPNIAGTVINVKEENGTVYISGIDKKPFDCEISVPKGIMLHIDYDSPLIRGEISVFDFNDIIEIKTLNANIKLSDCSGPLTINSTNGNIDLITNTLTQNHANSLVTVNGSVSVFIPKSLKLALDVTSVTGNIHSNLNDKLNAKATGILYPMNGGGQIFQVKTFRGNIYLMTIERDHVINNTSFYDPDPAIRGLAVIKSNNQTTIDQIALNDNDPVIRRLALGKINSQTTINHVAMNDPNSDVRKIALGKTSSQTTINHVALNDKDPDVRKIAMAKTSSQSTISQVAMNDPNSDVRKIALAKTSSQTTISHVALNDPNSDVRILSVEKSNNQSTLNQVARNDKDPNVRKIALQRLTQF